MPLQSNVWNALSTIKDFLESQFDLTGTKNNLDHKFDHLGCTDQIWTSSVYRKAHITAIDQRESKGMWMLHCCIYPHLDNPAPIFGFDVIAGKNKITGCFHDFSPAGDKNHHLLNWFVEESKKTSWHKVRELPEWAERIFSKGIIAASNVQSSEEIDQIINLINTTLIYYLAHISETCDTIEETTIYQNFYIENQKLNPHNPRVLSSLGFNDEDVKVFIEQCLFPIIY